MYYLWILTRCLSQYILILIYCSALESILCGKVHKEILNVFQEFFTACLESVKTLPQFYQIDEVTSLTGGTFNPGLALTFEKQLLTMVIYS